MLTLTFPLTIGVLMSDLVTCPIAPGMLRLGTPIRDLDWPGSCGVVLDADGDYPTFFWGWDQSEPENPVVDLTDATGRAHAAWWAKSKAPEALWLLNALGLWLEQGWGDHDRWVFWTALRDGPVDLAILKPFTATRLPDGSRLVDALALKAVVEHLIAGFVVKRSTPKPSES